MNQNNAYPRTSAEQDQWIRENLNLIHSIAHSFQYCGIEYEDLFQEICEGAAKAMNTYDPSRGAKLSTYVVDCAKNHVKMELRKRNTLRRTAIVVSLEQSMSNSNGDKETSLLNQDNSEVDNLHSADPELSDTLHVKQIAQTIHDAMNLCLTDAQRIAIEMYASGYSQKDIGKKLNLSQGNVSKLLKIAICELRLKLEEMGITADSIEF